MKPGGGAEAAFTIDAESWTCPECGETYRGPNRRKVRDSHKCDSDALLRILKGLR